MRFPFGLVLTAILICTVVFDYVHRSTVFASATDLPEVAVVFTGQPQKDIRSSSGSQDRGETFRVLTTGYGAR